MDDTQKPADKLNKDSEYLKQKIFYLDFFLVKKYILLYATISTDRNPFYFSYRMCNGKCNRSRIAESNNERL